MGRIRIFDARQALKRIPIASGLLVAASLVLAACAKDAEEQVACPGVEVLQDLGEMVRFQPGPGRDVTDVLLEAWVDGVGGECFLGGNELTVDLNVRIGTRRGPATKTDKARIGYFVAITDPNRNVLVRERFETTAPFSSRKTILFEDILDLNIPLRPGMQTDGFSIYVGLELSEQELAYNRRKRQ